MRRLPLCVLAFTVLASAVATQGQALAEFEKRLTRALADNGQRHLQLGSWARDKGLVQQATAEFLLAVEVADGKNPGAIRVLGIMRSLDEAFWKAHRKRPSRALLNAFDKRAKSARRKDRAARLKVARFAHVRKLEDKALREYRAIVADFDEALEVDRQGRIVLDVGTVPSKVSEKLLAKAVTVDERRYIRDADLPGLPDALKIHERSSPELRVRGTVSGQRLADLHAVGMALLPHLEKHIGGRPVRRVRVFVFDTRAEYAVYLAANAMQRFANAGGFADYGAQQAIVCAEGCDDRSLRGLFLHELAHLYDYQVAPAAMPSWYCEALAESIGGSGAFRWQDGALQLGGTMSPNQRQRLAASIDEFSLRQLLTSNVGALFARDLARAKRFYVEAWGFLEFLRTGAGDSVAARFATWEAMCRGKALGAKPRQPGQRHRQLDAREARDMFEAMFGAEFRVLERGFVDWARGDR